MKTLRASVFLWFILLGRNKPLPFDITKPEGADHARELSVQHPEIAERLRTKLATWLATLTPPGPPRPLKREEGYISAEILPYTSGVTQP
jgi:hypothetical protein